RGVRILGRQVRQRVRVVPVGEPGVLVDHGVAVVGPLPGHPLGARRFGHPIFSLIEGIRVRRRTGGAASSLRTTSRAMSSRGGSAEKPMVAVRIRAAISSAEWPGTMHAP